MAEDDAEATEPEPELGNTGWANASVIALEHSSASAAFRNVIIWAPRSR